MNNAYEVLEERISEWGLSNDEIIAVYIVGSRARKDNPFDEFSTQSQLGSTDRIPGVVQPVILGSGG